MIDFFEERKRRRKASKKTQMIGAKVSAELKLAFLDRLREEKRKSQAVWLREAIEEKLKQPAKIVIRETSEEVEPFKGLYVGVDIEVGIVEEIAKRLVEEERDSLSVWFREAIEEKLKRPARKVPEKKN